eukprot:scaffold56048_cov63-Phaeocystis_antarctica.AAC.5
MIWRLRGASWPKPEPPCLRHRRAAAGGGAAGRGVSVGAGFDHACMDPNHGTPTLTLTLTNQAL